MNQGPMDLDPLSTYEYSSYNNYPTYPYNVKIEEPITYQFNNTNYINNGQNIQHSNNHPIISNESNNTPNLNVNDTINNDSKDDVKAIVGKRKEKKNGRSTYCSEKIADANFAFYGCAVCNISYTALFDLDQHVIIHKDRMTSYRLRLKNQVKKKQMKKEQKRLKKLSKIKKEIDIEIDIKPEDGYIGNETAGDYLNNKDSENNGAVPNLNSNGAVQNTSQNNGTIKDSENNGAVPNLNSNGAVQNTSQNNGTIKDSENNGAVPNLYSNRAVQNTSQNNGTIPNDTQNDNLNKENSNGNDTNENNSKDNEDKDATEMVNLEKIYKCFACKKQFTLSYYLKLHVRSHTDEKPYICSVCGQSFITASKLGRHNKRIHLAERYQCRICFKIFSRFQLLTAHFDKNHPDDKLEGEPYDYNAILPYLNELEEQLKLQDVKPKTEDIWSDEIPPPAPASTQPATETILQPQAYDQIESEIGIIVEEFKIDPDDDIDVKVKREESDDDGHVGDYHDPGDEACVDAIKNDSFKDESNSDEDYFPSKTWLSSPKMELSPPSPSQRRRKPSPLVCEVCNKRVSSASYMRVHLRTHSGERPFKCWHCGRGFITSSKMNRHVLTHEMDETEEGKSDAVAVKTEAEDNPDGEDVTVKTKKSSKKKMKSNFSKSNKKDGEKPKKKYQKRPHACEFCHQKFLHLEMLQVHKKCHEGETLVLKCNYCLVEASDEAALKEHEASHTGPKPYLCTVCGKCYKKKETMVYHKKHHKPDREFVCDICSKRFNAACKLHKHMCTHRADKFVLRYECPVCAHMFNTKYHVQMHLATHQKEGLILEENRSDILAMVLQNARKIPKQPDAPANLTDIIPTDERSRICNICGEIFHHFYYLEEHLKNHGSRIAIEDTPKDEEKKYICEICNKGFKLHYYLKLHSFTHTKEKPFICQQCGKGFITKGKLKRHLETHTGLKKYQCHICCKFFTRPSYLRIHIRTIHGTQDYNFRFDKYPNNMAVPVLTQLSDGSRSSM